MGASVSCSAISYMTTELVISSRPFLSSSCRQTMLTHHLSSHRQLTLSVMYLKYAFFFFLFSLLLGGMGGLFHFIQLFLCSVILRYRTRMQKEVFWLQWVSCHLSKKSLKGGVLLLGDRSLTKWLTNGKLLPFYHIFSDKVEHTSDTLSGLIQT